MADERVNRKQGESRVCKKSAREEIYEFSALETNSAYSTTFFWEHTSGHERQKRGRERESLGQVTILFLGSMKTCMSTDEVCEIYSVEPAKLLLGYEQSNFS